MNIFVLDRDPKKAAEYLNDKHIVKMPLESAQMLSTVQRINGSIVDNLYRQSHLRHPCTNWSSASKQNYKWHYELFFHMAKEYERRFLKQHKSFIALHEYLEYPPEILPDIGLTPFVQVLPDMYKHEDAVIAYRNYYTAHKLSFSTWRHPAAVPDWVLQHVKQNSRS